MRQQIREYWYISGRTIHNIDTHKRLVNDAYMQRYKLVAITMWLNPRLSTWLCTLHLFLVTCMQDHVDHECAEVLVLRLGHVHQDVAVIVQHRSKQFHNSKILSIYLLHRHPFMSVKFC